MDIQTYAKALGQRGGQARAKKLSRGERRKIASLGGRSRAESLRATKRISENFRYLEAINELYPRSKVKRVSKFEKRLPGIYP